MEDKKEQDDTSKNEGQNHLRDDSFPESALGSNKGSRSMEETLGRPQMPPPQPKDYEEIEY